jgi:hypothetical protein
MATKYTNDHKIYQMTKNISNGRKIDQMAKNCYNIVHYKTLKFLPKVEFWEIFENIPCGNPERHACLTN